MSQEKVVSLGIVYNIRTTGAAFGRYGYRRYVDKLEVCPACDAPGPIFIYRKDGDYYHEGCGFHIGAPPGNDD